MERAKILLVTLTFSITVFLLVNYLSAPSRNSPEAFYDISSKIRHLPMENYFGVTPFFFDKDKNFELLLSGYGVANVILSDNGFSLTPIEEESLKDPYGQTLSMTPCDLDGDGFNELFAINKHLNINGNISKNRLFKNINDKWVDLLGSQKPDNKSLSVSALCIDRDNDKRFELFVATDSQPLKYFELREGKLVDIAPDINISHIKAKVKSSIVVPDAMGNPNIFIGVEDGPNIFLKLNRNKKYDDFSTESNLSDPYNDARGISLIDYNNDEKIDIIFGNYEGPIKLFIQGENARFSEVKSKELNKKFYTSSLAVSDFNLDGTQDLYINSRSGKNYLFLHHRDQWIEDVISIGLEDDRVGTSILVGDLLFDGSNEILITHGSGEKTKPTLYSTKTHNNWIAILPLLNTGEIARNALVIVRTSIKKMSRVISTGSSPNSSNLPVAHFGLTADEEVINYKVIYNGRAFNFDSNKLQSKKVNIIEI